MRERRLSSELIKEDVGVVIGLFNIGNVLWFLNTFEIVCQTEHLVNIMSLILWFGQMIIDKIKYLSKLEQSIYKKEENWRQVSQYE